MRITSLFLGLVLLTSACGVDVAPADRHQGATTPPSARIGFLSNWYEHVSGELRQGGQLVIDYDLARLPQCRGTHNGHPAWDMVAHVRFSPGGQELSGSVRAFETSLGVPTNNAFAQPWELTIPEDAEEVEIWFENFSGAGNNCTAWDSRYGANYRFGIWPPASDPRCAQIERWERIASDMPYRQSPTCLAYTVDAHHDAHHCELALSAIAHGYMGHYGIPNRWVEAEIEVGPQLGELLGVGMYAQRRNKDSGELSSRVVMGRQLDGQRWQTGLITLRTAMMGAEGFAYDIAALAFFVDVRRPSGEIVRLWQSRDGANYTMNDAFALPTSTAYIPYGNVQWASPDAAIFDAKRACGR